MERVYLDESGPEHEIAILFRNLDRPDCLFGYGRGAVETSDVLHESTNPCTDLSSAAQVWAENVWVLFERISLPPAAGYPAAAPQGHHLDIGTPSRAC